MSGEDDVAAAMSVASRALAVCLYTGPGCGAHKRCESVDEAEAWCAEHKAARPDHRVDVWPTDIDSLAAVNSMSALVRAMRGSLIDAERVERAHRHAAATDPNFGKVPVPQWYYDRVKARVDASPLGASRDLHAILDRIFPIPPIEEPDDDRQDPRDQPIPIGRGRQGRRHRRRR